MGTLQSVVTGICPRDSTGDSPMWSRVSDALYLSQPVVASAVNPPETPSSDLNFSYVR